MNLAFTSGQWQQASLLCLLNQFCQSLLSLSTKKLPISTSRPLVASQAGYETRPLATRKHSKSVKFAEKLASLCFELSGTAYKYHSVYILVGHCSHTHQPRPLLICSSHTSYEQVKIINTFYRMLQIYASSKVCVGYVLYRALVCV